MEQRGNVVRQGQIAEQTERLHKVAEGIYEAINTLQDRINPILRAVPRDQSPPSDVPDEERAPLAYELSTIVTKLQESRERIMDMTARVEL
uniref:Uncharacterized protein n=1 Tax=viral metagenome TaxID=1070528 RepID=A0A6M3INP8_9ZZZZ